MRGRALIAGVAAVLVCVGAVAGEWEEDDRGPQILLDPASGLPAVVFHVTLEYTTTPDAQRVDTSWVVYELVDGVEVPIDGFSHTSIRSGPVRRIHSTSPLVQIEAGSRYGARMRIVDPVNDLSYERTFNFVAPPALPFGIRLAGWDASEDIDLTELPDEELEELVLLHDLLGGYSVGSEGTALEAFLRAEASTSEYPLSLLLLPVADIDPSAAPIRIYAIRNVYVYTLSGPDERAGVLDQLETFNQPFLGAIYVGGGRSILGGGKTVFVHDAVPAILDAAAAELSAR